MKIFISWSGARSRAVAEALNEWLKRVIQAVKPFYSPEIEKGAKWSNAIDAALEGTKFGIVCLTPDNLESRWIHYEVGALSKTPDALIWTFLHGVTPGNVEQPLGKFQHTLAEKGDVFKLMQTINARLADVGGESVSDAVLSENFELYWPKLEEKLNAAAGIGGLTQKPREDREILLELLDIARSQQRALEIPIVHGNATNVTYGISLAKKGGGSFTDAMLGVVKSKLEDALGVEDALLLLSGDRKLLFIQFSTPVPSSSLNDAVKGISFVQAA